MSECLSVRNTESEDKYFLHSSLLIRLQLAIQKSIDQGHILLISYLPREAVTHCEISGLNEISHVSCLMHDMHSFFCKYKRISINVSARNRPQQYKKNSNWGWRGGLLKWKLFNRQLLHLPLHSQSHQKLGVVAVIWIFLAPATRNYSLKL